MNTEAMAYFVALWARRDQAVMPQPMSVTFADGRRPEAGRCHDNVDLWVIQNQQYQPVRGWALNSMPGKSENWVAHSVVQLHGGPFLEITYPDGQAFLQHHGDEALFLRIRKAHFGQWLPPISN